MCLQEQQQELQSFLQLTESLDGQAATNSAFFALVLERKIPQQLASYMIDLFTEQQPAPVCSSAVDQPLESAADVPRHEGNETSSAANNVPIAEANEEAAGSPDALPAQVFCKSDSQQWGKATNQPGLLYALQLLTALVSHHEVRCSALHGRSSSFDCPSRAAVLQEHTAGHLVWSSTAWLCMHVQIASCSKFRLWWFGKGLQYSRWNPAAQAALALRNS